MYSFKGFLRGGNMKRAFLIVSVILVLAFLWSCYDNPVDEGTQGTTGVKGNRLFLTDGNEYNPVLSSDEKYIFFNSDIADETGASGTIMALWRIDISGKNLTRLSTAYEFGDTVFIGDNTTGKLRSTTETHKVDAATDTAEYSSFENVCSIKNQQFHCNLNYVDPHSISLKINGKTIERSKLIVEYCNGTTAIDYESRLINDSDTKWKSGDNLSISYNAWTNVSDSLALKEHKGSNAVYIRSFKEQDAAVAQALSNDKGLATIVDAVTLTSVIRQVVTAYTDYRIVRFSNAAADSSFNPFNLETLISSHDIKMGYPNLSEDGTRLVFSAWASDLIDPSKFAGTRMDSIFDDNGQSWQVWGYDLTNKKLAKSTPLSYGLIGVNIRPRIYRSGTKLLFQTKSSEFWKIYQVNFDGSGLTEVKYGNKSIQELVKESILKTNASYTRGVNFDVEAPRWHPTADKFLFSANPLETDVYANTDIFEYNNGVIKQFTVDASTDQDGCYGPGNKIIYSSNGKMDFREERVQFDIWTVTF
jgi:hypothetical protein